MPPAVFPSVMGLSGLGLTLRQGADVYGYPAGLAELVLGGVSLLWLFATLGYCVKITQRPGVVLDEVKTLPGRYGLVTMTLGVFLQAAIILPYSAAWALGLMLAGLVVHAGLALLVLHWVLTAPTEARRVTPVWHLHFAGFVFAGLISAPLGLDVLTDVLLWGSGALALVVGAISLLQMIRQVPPAPLRPILAIHLVPFSLLGIVAALNGQVLAAQVFAGLGLAILLALVLNARWLTVGGFSALWGAFTFPLAACASLLFMLGGVLLWPATLLLVAAIGVVPAIALKVIRAWTRGALAQKTNAATA
tara:strand:- start:1453 stop:2370 length:918 start_codon:yes stop_codon:yes gene_type:complete